MGTDLVPLSDVSFCSLLKHALVVRNAVYAVDEAVELGTLAIGSSKRNGMIQGDTPLLLSAASRRRKRKERSNKRREIMEVNSPPTLPFVEFAKERFCEVCIVVVRIVRCQAWETGLSTRRFGVC